MEILDIPGSQGSSNNQICRMCNKKVVSPVFCNGCSAPFHPKCADKTKVIPDIGFAKCFGPDASPAVSPNTTATTTQIITFIFQTMATLSI